MSKHDEIKAYLENLEADVEHILDINDLDSFAECDINQGGAVYLKKSGHILRGSPSSNASGRSKVEKVTKDAQDKKIQALVKDISERAKDFKGDKEELILELMFGSIVESKSSFELDAKLKAFGAYFIGKKQSISDDTNEDKKLVIQFGDLDTTKLLTKTTQKEELDEQSSKND